MQKILVTGASGFIGAWVVETLHLSGIPVRAGIRSWNSAVRLARRPLELVPCNVLAPEEVREAMRGCDAVVHCAVGGEEVIVQGTRNVLSLAQEMQIRRVVHLSSIAVYGSTRGVLDESVPCNPGSNRYGRYKVAAEQECQHFQGRGLPVTILRPTIVYGPFSYTWTVSFAQRLQSGRWGTLGPAGEGKCNLVYITDVVQAIVHSLQSSTGPDEVFNVNGPEIVTWNQYFTRFNEALNQLPLRPLPVWPLALKSRLLAPVRAAGRFALARFNDTLMGLNTRFALAAKYMKATESTLKLTPTSDQLKLFGLDAEYSIARAQQRIGYAPQVSLAQGLEFSVAWLRTHQLLSPESPSSRRNAAW